MKVKFLRLLLPLAIGVAFNAHAQSSGNITIDGTVNNAACTPSVNGSGPNATVMLPTISANQTFNQGQLRDLTPFSISLSGCAPGVNVARAHFYSNYASSGTLQKTSGNGSGWGYVILPAGYSTYGDRIVIGSSSSVVPQATDPGGNLFQGATSITYQVGYYGLASNANMSRGTLNSEVNYVMYYQ